MQVCKGKTKTGASCRAPASAGGLCFFHANPDSARALGQIGGRKNRRSVVDLQVPDNMSAADLRNVTVQAIRLLLSGDMHAREASALAQLCNSLYRFIPTVDLEARVAMLEAQFIQEGSGNLPDHAPISSPTPRPEPGEKVAQTEVDQHNRLSIDDDPDSRSHYEDGGESSSHGSNEAEGEA
jgi:hypothetical protein